jgi:Bacterial archaeo-eukaryotic release factor family 3
VELLAPVLIDGLLAAPSSPCVSIYLSGHRSSPSDGQGRLELKNLIAEAEEHLLEQGLRRPAAAELLAPARDLLADDDFWQHRQSGLAVFLAPGFSEWLWLPIEPQGSVVVGERFALRSLLPAMWPDQRFYVLAISPDGHRLFRGSRWEFEQLDVRGAPRTVKEMLAAQGVESDAAMRTGSGRSRQQGGVAFRGHGVERSTGEDRTIEFFRRVDKAVVEVLKQDPGPLIVAATSEQAAIYREATTWQDLAEHCIEGNPDGVKAGDLHEKAWLLVKNRACGIQQRAFDRYREQAGHDRAALGPAVLPAAYQGKVDTLFLPEQNGRYWGRFDAMSGDVEVHEQARPDDEDLLDLAAAYTLSRGGRVYVMPSERMPEGAPLAALLRF